MKIIQRQKYLTLLFFSFIACQSSDKEFYKDGSLKSIKINKGYSKKIEFYQNGDTSIITHWMDGKLSGEARYYYPKNKLQFITFYKDGKKNGYGIEYYKTGKIMAKEHYVMGVKEGEMHYYDSLGEIKYTINIHSGEWIYTKDYNAIQPYISVNLNKDTFNIGDTLLAKFIFVNKKYDSMKLYLGNLENRKLIDTIYREAKKDTGFFKFTKRIDNYGPQKLEGIMINFQKYDSITFRDEFGIQKKYFVSASPS